MITKKMTGALNKQIGLEAYASFLYLSMASWCDQQSLEGCAQFMFRQSTEEYEHMMRIFNYLLEVDANAESPQVDKAPVEFNDVKKMFEQVYKHEQKVTAAINELVDLSIQETDHATNNFLQWYVDEQREEETLMRSILDKIKLIGDSPQSLYFIDKEVSAINKQAEKEEQK
jgi:ferritin